MQGMILAAGMGKRLKELTQNNTKCMVKVNGITLAERVLRQLDALKLERIVIVVGYEGQKLMDYIATLDIATPIVFVDNPIYDKTNNIYSLALAKDYLVEDDTLLLESDLIFEDSVLQLLLDDPRDTLTLVDKYESWMDGTCIKIGEDDSIEAFIPGKKFRYEESDEYYKTVNIYKFGKEFSEKKYVPFLEAYSSALGNNEYYEQVLRVIVMLDEPGIKAKKLSGQLWYEIDDVQDLDIASSMFAPDDEEKLSSIQARYGGYWRYPRLLDFCYLVNPYYPSQRMFDEMKASFEKLITQYPSGMAVNSLLAGRNFEVNRKHILVGNGAAELIKSLMEKLEGRLGYIRPTFEEYPNRVSKAEPAVFYPDNADFAYTAEDIKVFFDDKNIDTLLLINPDNPSGNYICRSELLGLLDWCREKNIRPVVDESFVDFADEKNTLIDEEIFAEYPSLIVVKSISKSFGVPGIRLGVLASGDDELIAKLKKDVAIWNINSFGEFYMQIFEKYRKDYAAGCEKLRQTRREFAAALSEIKGLRVIPSQANYLMAELTSGISSRELTKTLLVKYDLFIKDLAGKVSFGGEKKNYIRLAVRNTEDNMKLISALKEILD